MKHPHTKKFAAAALLVILLSGGIYFHAFGYPFFQGYASYSCNQGYSRLVQQQGGYYFSAPVYVPKPGYGYTFGPVAYNPPVTSPATASAVPPDATVQLTLLPPRNILDAPLPPLTVVPPLQVQYSFPSAVPIRKFTVYINKDFAMGYTQISCQVAGIS